MTPDKPMTVSDEQPSSDKLDAARVFLGPFLADEGLEGQLLGKQSGAVYDASAKALATLQAQRDELREAGNELAEEVKINKAGLTSALTRRELGFLMDALHKWNVAQDKQP